MNKVKGLFQHFTHHSAAKENSCAKVDCDHDHVQDATRKVDEQEIYLVGETSALPSDASGVLQGQDSIGCISATGLESCNSLQNCTDEIAREIRRKSSNGSKHYPHNSHCYELLEEIGKGTSATVWRALCTQHNEEVAVKLVELDAITIDLDLFHQETATVAAMRSPYVVPLYAAFIEQDVLWMVQHLVDNGDLNQLVTKSYPQGVEERVLATLTKMVLRGLHYIHDHGYVHRDIKAANLLLGHGGVVMIADFTVARQLDRAFEAGDPVTVEKAQDFAGTIAWMAPEIIEGVGADSKADIWSLGMTVVELAWGEHPWLGTSVEKLMMDIIHGDPPQLPTTHTWSHNMMDFLELCLTKDPAQRPGVEELLHHPWMKGVSSTQRGAKLMKKMLHQSKTLRKHACMLRERRGSSCSFASWSDDPEMEDEQFDELQRVSSTSSCAFPSTSDLSRADSTPSLAPAHSATSLKTAATELKILNSFVHRGWSLPEPEAQEP